MRHFNRTTEWAVEWAKQIHPDRTSEWDRQQHALKNLKTIAVLLHKKLQDDKLINQ